MSGSQGSWPTHYFPPLGAKGNNRARSLFQGSSLCYLVPMAVVLCRCCFMFMLKVLPPHPPPPPTPAPPRCRRKYTWNFAQWFQNASLSTGNPSPMLGPGAVSTHRTDTSYGPGGTVVVLAPNVEFEGADHLVPRRRYGLTGAYAPDFPEVGIRIRLNYTTGIGPSTGKRHSSRTGTDYNGFQLTTSMLHAQPHIECRVPRPPSNSLTTVAGMKELRRTTKSHQWIGFRVSAPSLDNVQLTLRIHGKCNMVD